MTFPRRFRFGLRSMFVLVTVASITTAWLTHSFNWIRQRHAYKVGLNLYGPAQDHLRPTAPGGLWLFGEKGVWVIRISTTKREVERAKQLFPEANVVSMRHPLPP